jgi:hypothetical protein
MRRLRVATAVFASAICGVFVSAAPALAGTGSIAGTVTDDSPGHAALQGAQVCHYEPSGATEEACTTTDASGNYQLSGLNPGEYIVTFRAPTGQNYVRQYYNGKTTFTDADKVVVGSGPVTGINAEMHEGGSITGIVTETGSGMPITGLSVCASGNGGLYGGCTVTGGDGTYTITGLPADTEYQVEFSAILPASALNYLTQYYDGREEIPGDWDPVPVEVGIVTSGIDAAMKPGAQIAGRVTEAGTGTPLTKVEVCVLDPAETPRAEEFERCAYTGPGGDYVVRSLPAGTYVVQFARERGFMQDTDGLIEEFFNGVATEAEATRITIAPPETRSDIDADLNVWPRPGPVVTVTITPLTQQPVTCRKGFRKRRVKGKVHCVKVCRKGFRPRKVRRKVRCVGIHHKKRLHRRLAPGPHRLP